jgi:cell wall-associated NlpC family hydrolase
VTTAREFARNTTGSGGVSTGSKLPPLVQQITDLQKRLHLDPVDGSFGPVTLQAVEQFQQEHGLTVNGVVGEATRKALHLGTGPTLRPQAELLPAPTPPVVPSDQQQAAAPGTAVHETGGSAVRQVAVHSTTPAETGPSTGVQAGLRKMDAAGNRIATRPYVYGGGHASFNSYGYDCSGSVSYVLHAAGLLSSPEDSTELESYGKAGPGKYVTIYANSGHAWMTIQGRRFDTVALAETGSRWAKGGGEFAGMVERHPGHY